MNFIRKIYFQHVIVCVLVCHYTNAFSLIGRNEKTMIFNHQQGKKAHSTVLLKESFLFKSPIVKNRRERDIGIEVCLSSNSNTHKQGNSWRSMTAIRKTVRATTGFSLTAVRATLRGLTGISVTQTMKSVAGIFPAWPLLVMYYVPLMLLRGLLAENTEQRATHESFIASWKNAVKIAASAQKGGYWPVRLNSEGQIEASLPPDPNVLIKDKIDLTNAIVKSIEVAKIEEEKKN